MEIYHNGKKKPQPGRSAPGNNPRVPAAEQRGSLDDIQNLFKETIAELMENGHDAELDNELGYSRYDYRNKDTDNSRNGHRSKTL